MKPNPKTAAAWPVGTRVRATASGWTGEVVRVLGARSGSGAVRVAWDEESMSANVFAEPESVVSNPSLNLERI